MDEAEYKAKLEELQKQFNDLKVVSDATNAKMSEAEAKLKEKDGTIAQLQAFISNKVVSPDPPKSGEGEKAKTFEEQYLDLIGANADKEIDWYGEQKKEA